MNPIAVAIGGLGLLGLEHNRSSEVPRFVSKQSGGGLAILNGSLSCSDLPRADSD
jgi:hypothetical protein